MGLFDVFKKKENKNEMVLVKGGKFLMGSEVFDNEKPIQNITVNSFYISTLLVTVKFYKKVMSDDPSYFKLNNNPVEQVCWYDAIEFCNKLSEIEGFDQCYEVNKDKKDKNNESVDDEIKWTVKCNFNKNGYRLPTEAEWEYAARGGTQSRGYKYSGSNDVYEVAWFCGNSDELAHPVGKKKPNEIGIYDMSGNVYEWCWDWYDENYYENGQNNNPHGPAIGRFRVIRGGGWYWCDKGSEVIRQLSKDGKKCGYDIESKLGIVGWQNNPSYCRSANRLNLSPDEFVSHIGFRTVRSLT